MHSTGLCETGCETPTAALYLKTTPEFPAESSGCYRRTIPTKAPPENPSPSSEEPPKAACHQETGGVQLREAGLAFPFAPCRAPGRLFWGCPPPPPSGTSAAGVGSRGSPTAGDRRAAAGSRELRGSESPSCSTPACRPGTSPSLRSQGLEHGTAAEPRCPQRGSARGGLHEVSAGPPSHSGVRYWHRISKSSHRN